MPATNALPATGAADTFSRSAAVNATSNGNETAHRDAAAQTAPAGAGPAAVVNISEAARDLSAGLGKPGLNNGTMAAEGGTAAELRGLLTERYDAHSARLDRTGARVIE